MHDFFSELALMAATSDEEICGFLLNDTAGSMKLMRVENVSPADKAQSFEIKGSDYLTAVKSGMLVGVFHTHVNDPALFSDADIQMADISRLPFLLYSKKDRSFNFYRPPSTIAAYEGRQFMLLASDCVSLAADYYKKEFNKEFPYIHRTPSSLREGFKGVVSLYESSGFERVAEPKDGDILLIALGAAVGATPDVINHVAVYVGRDTVLHQMMGQRSGYRRYQGLLKDQTKFILRRR